MITENHLEELCIDCFKNGGYDYVFGPDITFDGTMPECLSGDISPREVSAETEALI